MSSLLQSDFKKWNINHYPVIRVKHPHDAAALNFGTVKVKAIVDISSPLESVSPETISKEHYLKVLLSGLLLN